MKTELYPFLPSFLKNHLADGNGGRCLDAFLDLYGMAADDTWQRMADIDGMMDIDKCPNVFRELYKTFEFADTKPINGRYRYPLKDRHIIHIERLYKDARLAEPFDGPYRIGDDVFAETRFLEFGDARPIGEILYAEEAYVDTYPVIEFYGKLLGHTPKVTLRREGALVDGIYYIDFPYIQEQLETIRQETFSLLHIRMKGATADRLTNFIAAILGYPISRHDGMVTGLTNGLTADCGGAIETFGSPPNPKFALGGKIKKFDSLLEPPVYVYDFYSNPSRFIQTLLADGAKILVDLMSIDTGHQEQYASLFWDSGLDWDKKDASKDLLFYDMGNSDIPDIQQARLSVDSTPLYGLPIDTAEKLVDDFTPFADNRFTSPSPTYSIAELFSGVTIIEVKDTSRGRGFIERQFERLLPIVKPGFTKFVVVWKH